MSMTFFQNVGQLAIERKIDGTRIPGPHAKNLQLNPIKMEEVVVVVILRSCFGSIFSTSGRSRTGIREDTKKAKLTPLNG